MTGSGSSPRLSPAKTGRADPYATRAETETAGCSADDLSGINRGMNAYSEDLREKIIEALRRAMGKSQAARTFCVSLSSVKR